MNFLDISYMNDFQKIFIVPWSIKILIEKKYFFSPIYKLWNILKKRNHEFLEWWPSRLTSADPWPGLSQQQCTFSLSIVYIELVYNPRPHELSIIGGITRGHVRVVQTVEKGLCIVTER